jgi:hypothetical protein
MNPVLAQKLIEKGVLAADTEVEATYPVLALGGAAVTTGRGIFLITKVLNDAGFEVISTRDGSSRRLAPSNIVAIDGMDPIRFASVYNVKADGIEAKEGKRRGRKPKVRTQVNG